MQKIRYRVVWNRRKKLNSQGKALVQVEASLQGRKIYMSTRVYLRPEEWDACGAKVSDTHPNHVDLNAYLFQFMFDLERVELNIWKRGNVPTLQQLKDSLGDIRKVDISFDSFARESIEMSDRRSGSKENLLVTLKLLKEFKPAYDWNDLTYNFLREFENFLRIRGNAVNTIGKHLTNLRTLINEAIRQGYVTSNPFASYKIKKEVGAHSFLTAEELKKLEKFTPSKASLAKVRDAFLFCCYVGLRFSDFKMLTREHIVKKEGVEWLKFKSKKTGVDLDLPLYLLGGGKALKLIAKYEDIRKLNKIGCNADVNRKLRDLMTEVGISKRVTFHSSRHTCATSLVYNGVPITTVQKVLGHRKISTTQIYSEVHGKTLVKDLSKLHRM